MKVLMFGWEFPPYISGGLGTACFGLTKHMAAQGADILFCLPRVQGDAPPSHVRLMGANQLESMVMAESLGPQAASMEGDTDIVKHVRSIAVDSSLCPYLSEEQYPAYLEFLEKRSVSGGMDWFRLTSALRDMDKSILNISGEYGRNLLAEVSRYAQMGGLIAATENFDVIHAHDWMTYRAGIQARRISAKPLIIHVHATEFDRSGEHPNSAIYQIEKEGMESADRIVAVSYRTKDMIVARYAVAPGKIHVVHNAVSKEKRLEREQVKKHLKEKIVLFLGRVTMQKGPDYFVEAANLVLRKVKNVRFVMAGSGDMLPRMIERIAHLRMQKYFHFAGFLRGVDVEKMFAMSDVYVMPSVSEPFGITPFEAMLYGVPAIISKQSGIAEILHHALKVDFWDIEKLAGAIIDILTHPTLSETMVQAGIHELESISWDHAARRILEIYQEAGD